MYWCKGCDNPFEELVECTYDDGTGETYMGCPYCQSDEYRDLVSEAEALEDR